MRKLRNNRTIDVKNSGSDDDIVVSGNSTRTIIAVDFDGTLVFNNYPFIENPNLELIEFIKAHRKEYVWILWTCRHNEQLAYAVEYMKTEHGITFDFVNKNATWLIDKYGDTRKIFADYYIDDRNIENTDLKKFLKNKKGLNG